MSEPTANALHLETIGTGRTIVLSHGVGDSSAVWRDWLPLLGERARAVAWDQPGHGASEAVDADRYGPRLAYESLCRVVGDEEGVVLIGHSLGGYLSCRFTIEHPAQVAALVLIATGPGFRSPDAMAKWNADNRAGVERSGRFARLVGLHEDAFVMDHLAEIACPALVLVGSEDAAFLGATDYIQKKIPTIERHTIDGAGHDMPSTRGVELAGIVQEFLTRRLG